LKLARAIAQRKILASASCTKFPSSTGLGQGTIERVSSKCESQKLTPLICPTPFPPKEPYLTRLNPSPSCPLYSSSSSSSSSSSTIEGVSRQRLTKTLASVAHKTKLQALSLTSMLSAHTEIDNRPGTLSSQQLCAALNNLPTFGYHFNNRSSLYQMKCR